MTPLLEAVSLALPRRLEPTDLSIPAPALVCVIGPNGSGKTSLLHAVAGIGAPEGRVRVDGIDARRAPPPERRRLFSYLPAGREILWPLSARDVVGLALGDGEAAVDDALAELELGALAERRVDRLSTGERSRVLLARALAARPRLLLLDEPVANLDPLWQLRLMERLRAHVDAKRKAVLVALHDLDLAGRFADRLIVMNGGRIVADGAPQGLLAGPIIRTVFGIERKDGEWSPAR